MDGNQRQWNIGRDAVAVVLLLVALALPWNVYFGYGVPDSPGWLLAVQLVVTASSGAGLAAGHLGGGARRGVHQPAPGSGSRLRLWLNVPYLALVAAVIGFAILQVALAGGSGSSPAGVGPGALTGLAGALLAAQPIFIGRDVEPFRRWFHSVSVIGVVAMVAASCAVLLNLYWRTRNVLPNLGNSGATTTLCVILAYALVAWAVVIVGLRWLRVPRVSSRLAVVALGAAAVLGLVLVGALGVGREIDAFHGIAQTTSTASVGFEAYVAWIAGAAILGPLTLRQVIAARPCPADWREMARKCLSFIAFWCLSAALLRAVDLIAVAGMGFPDSPYNRSVLLAVDVLTAAGALSVRFGLKTGKLHPLVNSAMCAVLVVITVCRVVLGVGLATTIRYSSAPSWFDSSPFGNMLQQQYTCTFDVVVCWLAVAVTAVVSLVLATGDRPRAQGRLPVPVGTATVRPAAAPSPAAPVSMPVSVPQVPSAPAAPPAPAAAPIRIAAPRPAQPGTDAETARALGASTQRFGAGTTYTGDGRGR